MAEQDRTPPTAPAAASPGAGTADRAGACCTSRRQALAGVGLVGGAAALLTACGGGSSEDDAPEIDAQHPVDIAAVADVPVGGSYKATSGKTTLMLSQPKKGEFHAFSAVCTHQGCTLDADNENFHCPCHSSEFSGQDGSVLGGPAQDSLKEYKVTVDGDRLKVG